MFGWLTLRRRVERLESEVAGIQRLYEKTRAYSESDPRSALMNARLAAEAVCARVFEDQIRESSKGLTLQTLIQRLTQKKAVPEHILIPLGTIQRYGNFVVHHQPGELQTITAEFAQPCLQALGQVVQWYFEEYARPGGERPTTDERILQKPALLGILLGFAVCLGLAVYFLRGHWSRHNAPGSSGVAANVSLETEPGASNRRDESPSALAAAVSRPDGNPPGTPAAVAVVPGPQAPLSLTALYSASTQPRLAVLPFRCSMPDASDAVAIADELTSTLTSRLANSRLVSLVERDQLDKVFEELDLSRNARFNPAEVAKIGRLLGAKQLLLGSFYQDAKAMRVDARIVDTETAFVLTSALRKGKPEDATALIESLCDDVVKSLEEASQQAEKEPK